MEFKNLAVLVCFWIVFFKTYNDEVKVSRHYRDGRTNSIIVSIVAGVISAAILYVLMEISGC